MSLKIEYIAEYICTNFGVDDDDINEHTSLFSSGILDSFNMVELITFIEQETKIKFGILDLNMDNLDSLNSIISFVEKKQS